MHFKNIGSNGCWQIGQGLSKLMWSIRRTHKIEIWNYITLSLDKGPDYFVRHNSLAEKKNIRLTQGILIQIGINYDNNKHSQLLVA